MFSILVAALLSAPAFADDEPEDSITIDYGAVKITYAAQALDDIPESIVLRATEDGAEARAATPYKNFKFIVHWPADAAEAGIVDLCLEGACPPIYADVGDVTWEYEAEPTAASDPEWKYVPVRRFLK